MKYWSSLSLKARILISFGVLVLILVGTTTFAYSQLRASAELAQQALHVDANMAEAAARAQVHALGLRRFEKDFFLNMGNEEEQRGYLVKWQHEDSGLREQIDALLKGAAPEDRPEIASIQQERAVYVEGFQHVVAAVMAHEI